LDEAIVLCEGAFASTHGKTAHGLVRYSQRHQIVGVIDSALAGEDAGRVLDGKDAGIPIFATIRDALGARPRARWLVLGVATDGGAIPTEVLPILREAVQAGLGIESGLQERLNDRPDLAALAAQHGVRLVDVLQGPPPGAQHAFTGRIDDVASFRIAVLGTDSAIGKRTTARILDQALQAAGLSSVFIGTGPTARLQGAKYGICLDAIVHDFVTGEIEHAILSAFDAEKPDVILLEGHGAITHPVFPGGFELIAAGRPHAIVLQHAPGRKTLDGFAQYAMPDLAREIQILELLSQKPVVAITLNHESLGRDDVERIVQEYERKFKVPCCDPLWHGVGKIVEAIQMRMGRRVGAKRADA
jgi:uncharacterized NAD-dependent epimerase/dehydratase family protein